MDSGKQIAEKMEQIVEWAESRDNTIRYQRVVDILCDKDETITESIIADVITELENRAILVVWDGDEDYSSEAGDAQDFIPADVNISQKPMNVYNLMERLENNEKNKRNTYCCVYSGKGNAGCNCIQYFSKNKYRWT